MSTADEIKKLNELLRDRVITQEEFDLQKEKLLNSASSTTSNLESESVSSGGQEQSVGSRDEPSQHRSSVQITV